MVKLATWNLGFWQFRRTHDEAWAYLREEICPDIALLQEVKPPKCRLNEALVFQPVHREWGTAVYARGLPLQELLISRYPGRVAVAITQVHASELALASVHAPIINGRVFPHLDFIFNELETVLKNRATIVGGDLNSARLCEVVWPGYGHGPFFERIERGPFVDCHWKFHRKEVQTYFRKNSPHPWQDDHIFASPDVVEKFVCCTVLDNSVTRRLSDHIPLIAEIEAREAMSSKQAAAASRGPSPCPHLIL
jgi:endonuclease/exonuclease/phosphatase family metal-dependent hydrolase